MKHIATNIGEYLKEEIKTDHELPEYWYHGSNKYFDKFTLNDLGKNWHQSTLGVYFSQYLKPGLYGSTAKEYAEDSVEKNGGKPYVYKCKINANKPLVLDSKGWYSSNTLIDTQATDIKKQMGINGNDCVIVYNSDNKEEDGLQWGDYILVSDELDKIEIIDIIEFDIGNEKND